MRVADTDCMDCITYTAHITGMQQQILIEASKKYAKVARAQ